MRIARRYFLGISALVLALILVTGCAGFKNGVKDFTSMTPKEKALVMGQVFLAQKDAYIAKQNGPLTEADKKIMRVQYEIMEKMQPLLLTYMIYADTGTIPPDALANQLLPLYLQLLDTTMIPTSEVKPVEKSELKKLGDKETDLSASYNRLKSQVERNNAAYKECLELAKQINSNIEKG